MTNRTIANRRAGLSMLHIQAVIAVVGILTVMATLWAAQTMKFASRVRNHQRQHSQLTRLARDLRADVHLSRSITIEDSTRLVLQLDDQQTFVYEIKDETIRVEKNSGDQVRREAYKLSTRSKAEWDTSGLPDRVGLIVTRLGHAPKPASLADADSSKELLDPHLLEWDRLPIDISIQASKSRWPTRFSISSSAAKDNEKERDEESSEDKNSNDEKEPALESSPEKAESKGGGQ